MMQTLYGILISPTGDAVAIDDEEHELIARLLTIQRSTDPRGDAFNQAIYNLLWSFQNKTDLVTSKEVAQSFVINFLQNRESDGYQDTEGLLAGFHSENWFTLNHDQLVALKNTYKVLSIGGWFADWLDDQVATIATGTMPEDRSPSPLKIAGTLNVALANWQEKVESTKRFAELRPDLLFPAPPAEPEAAAEPSTTSKAPKAQRARKGRGKAA